MNRDPDLPLTETTYYTLVALQEPCHGYKILNRIKELSNGEVYVAPGTLYGALDNLEKQGWITLVEEVGSRKKVFRIGKKGLEVLEKERKRLIHMAGLLDSTGKEAPPSRERSSGEGILTGERKEKSDKTVGAEKKGKARKKREEDLFY